MFVILWLQAYILSYPILSYPINMAIPKFQLFSMWKPFSMIYTYMAPFSQWSKALYDQ